MGHYYLCMEVGGTNLRYGVVDEAYQLLEFEKISTEGLSDAADKGEYIENLLHPFVKKYGKEKIICLTLSLASLMNRDRTICYSSPNIRGFDNLPLKSVLEKQMGLPVCMERDANTSLLYEMWKNDLPKEGILAGIFIGTGIGNAMCIDGNIYTGSTGSSCELGHISIPGWDEMCGCGKKGCIALHGCGKVLAQIAQEQYHCPVQEIFIKHGEAPEVKDIVRMCAFAAAAEVTILDPTAVVLGGGVTEMEGFPLRFFTDTVRENLRAPYPRETLRIVLASGDPEAGIVGAAIHASKILKKMTIKSNK